MKNPNNPFVSFFLLLSIALLLTNCTNDKAVENNLCGSGEEILVEANSFCVYQQAITETGFRCPELAPFRFEYEEIIICCEDDQLLDHTDAVREEYQRLHPSSCAEGCNNEPVCTPGQDQTCNDDLEISSITGICNDDGTCSCPGEINPATGLCRAGSGPVCIPGMDQTCNDEAEISSITGTCNDDGTCSCPGEINPATGRCRAGIECPEMTSECPLYAGDGMNLFCDDGDLYACSFACHMECGCDERKDFQETCEGGCTDNEDGNAHCGVQPVVFTFEHDSDIPESVYVQSSDSYGLPTWVTVKKDDLSLIIFDRCDLPVCGEETGVCGEAIHRVEDVTGGEYEGEISLTWDGYIRVDEGDCWSHVPAEPGEYTAEFCFGYQFIEGDPHVDVVNPQCYETQFTYPTEEVVYHWSNGG